MKVKICSLGLGGLWLTVSGMLVAATDIDHSTRVSLERSASTSATVMQGMSFSLDALLEKPEITLTDGKNLMVVLDEALKLKLLAEKKLPDVDRKVTKAFVEYFEKTKSARVFDQVIGFYFLIDSTETIYRQTFLGENAE